MTLTRSEPLSRSEVIDLPHTEVRRQLLDILTPRMAEVHAALKERARYIEPGALAGEEPYISATEIDPTMYFPSWDGNKNSHKLFWLFGKNEEQMIAPKRVLRSNYIHFAPGAQTGYAAIGEYGDQWSHALMNGGRALLLDIMSLDFPGVSREDALLIEERTYQGNNSNGEATAYARIIKEGIAATIGAAAILTVQKVKGYDEPADLLDSIFESGLMNSWASSLAFSDNAHIAFRVNQPLPRNLIVPKKMLPFHPRRVAFSEHARPYLAKFHKIYNHKHQKRNHAYQSGKGCPVAIRHRDYDMSAVQMLFDLYRRYVRFYTK